MAKAECPMAGFCATLEGSFYKDLPSNELQQLYSELRNKVSEQINGVNRCAATNGEGCAIAGRSLRRFGNAVQAVERRAKRVREKRLIPS